MSAAGIYALYKDGEYQGDFLAKEICEKLNMSRGTFSPGTAENRLMRGHYTAELVDLCPGKRSPLWIEFDLVRKDILKKAGKI